MKSLLLILLFVVSALAAQDRLPVLRISTQIEGAWDLAGAFQASLERQLQGLNIFKIQPASEREALTVQAQQDPIRRDSSTQAIIDKHYPYDCMLDIQIHPPILESGRRSVLFFLGERRISLHANMRFYAVRHDLAELQGELSADTSISMGYCGILDCLVEPVSAQQRLQVESALFAKVRQQIYSRLESLLKIPADYVAKRDSLDNELRKVSSFSISSSQAGSSSGSQSSSSP